MRMAGEGDARGLMSALFIRGQVQEVGGSQGDAELLLICDD